MSELKRVTFGNTLSTNFNTNSVNNNNGSSNSNNNEKNSNDPINLSSLSSSQSVTLTATSTINLKKGSNVNLSNNSTTAEISKVQRLSHNENASILLSSVSMPPPSSSTVLSSSNATVSSLVSSETPSDTRQQQSVSSTSSSSNCIRIELELFDPNSKTFPEFNYLQVLKQEKKKSKKSRINGFSDPFEENNDDVARIAKEYEKKYGKKRNRRKDWYDKGAGYDESDSFIDNSEAYDELIPDEVETVEGGFYINCGALVFKHSSDYEKVEEAQKENKSRKRILSSSSSSSSEEDDEDEEDDEEEEDDNDLKSSNELDEEMTDVGNSSPKEKEKKTEIGNTSSSNPTIKLKNGHHLDKKLKSDDTSNKEVNAIPSPSSSPSLSLVLPAIVKQKEKKPENLKLKVKDDVKVDEMLVDPIKEKDKEKTIKTTTVKDMLKAKRDSYRKQQEDENKLKMTNGETSNGTTESSADDSDSEPSEKKFKKSVDDDEQEKVRSTDVKLPTNLKDNLVNNIQEMIRIGKMQPQFPKNFQFDDKLMEIFVRIDDECLGLDKPVRNLVYAHIEYQLSLTKYYLLRKSKQLRIKNEKAKLKKVFTKFKKSLNEVLPSILFTYEENYKKIDEIRSLLSQSDLEKMEHPPKYPKKKFPWNNNLRNFLYDLYQTRLISFSTLKTKKEDLNSFIYNYLKEKVIPLWPSGWMKYDDLKKELDKILILKKAEENKKHAKGGNPTSQSIHKSENSKDNISVGKTSSTDLAKSALSSSNSLSVVSTKDLVVTIGTKNSQEKLSSALSEVPISSTSSTPQVFVDNSSKTKGIGKTQKDGSYFSSHHKSSKSSNSGHSTNSSGASKSPSPSHLDYNQMSIPNQKTLSISTSNNVGKNGSKTNVNSITNVNNNQKLQNITSTNLNNKGPLDLVSPTKRSTDHSISTIISSSLLNPSLPPSTLNIGKSGSSNENSTTHVITVDNMKSTSDIINTTNQLLSGNSNGSNSNNIECPIRIRSFANVTNNSEIERTKNSSNNAVSEGLIKSELINVEEESDSGSDCVEIVGEYQQEPSINKSNAKGGGGGGIKLKKEGKDSDVEQIMRALKELEKLQQANVDYSKLSSTSSSSSSSSSSSTSVSKHKKSGNSSPRKTSSPNSYEKDIKK